MYSKHYTLKYNYIIYIKHFTIIQYTCRSICTSIGCTYTKLILLDIFQNGDLYIQHNLVYQVAYPASMNQIIIETEFGNFHSNTFVLFLLIYIW